jgi:hypothetical protein
MAESPGVRAGKPRSDGSWVRRFNQLLVLAGLEPLRLLHTARTLPEYLRNYREYRRLQRRPAPPDFPVTHRFPMLHDRTATAGRRGAYLHQDLLVARRILERRPAGTSTSARASTASWRTSPCFARSRCWTFAR